MFSFHSFTLEPVRSTTLLHRE